MQFVKTVTIYHNFELCVFKSENILILNLMTKYNHHIASTDQK